MQNSSRLIMSDYCYGTCVTDTITAS